MDFARFLLYLCSVIATIVVVVYTWSVRSRAAYLRFLAARRRQAATLLTQHYFSLRLAALAVTSRNKRKYSFAWYREVFIEWSDEDFRRNLRMNRRTFFKLVKAVEVRFDRKSRRGRSSYPTELKIAACLWRLGTQSEYRTLSPLFGVSESSLCKWMDIFINAVIDLLGHHINLPAVNTPERAKIHRGFLKLTSRPRYPGLAQILGAIDCTHIPLFKPPTEFPEDYFDRKHQYSIITQAVADAQCRFLDVFVGPPGAYHDARVLRISKLNANAFQLFNDEVHCFSLSRVPFLMSLIGVSYC